MGIESRFEVLKEIGDGSFGSVALARVRSGGASVARRGTVVRPFFSLKLPFFCSIASRDRFPEKIFSVVSNQMRFICDLLGNLEHVTYGPYH